MRVRPVHYQLVALLWSAAVVACSAILDTQNLDRARCDQASDCAAGEACDLAMHLCTALADGGTVTADAAIDDASSQDSSLPDGGSGQLPISDWQYELTGAGSPVLVSTALDPAGNVLLLGESDAAVVGQNSDFGGGAAQTISASTYPQLFFSGLSGDGQNLVFNQHISADPSGPRVPMAVLPGTVGDAGDNLLAVMLVPDPPASVEVVGFLYDPGGFNGGLTTDSPVRAKIALADAGVDAGDAGYTSTLSLTASQRLPDGALYLAGYFAGAITVGSKTFHSLPSGGAPSQDGLLVRIDPDGTDVKAWVFASVYDDQIVSLCAVNDKLGLAGFFSSNGASAPELDFAGAAIAQVKPAGKEDGFFAVFDDTTGTLTTAAAVGGPNTDSIHAITYLPTSNELVVGGRAQLPFTVGHDAFVNGNENTFVLLAAFDATAGTPLWAQLFDYGGNSQTAINALTPAPGDGDLLVGGKFSGDLDLGTGPLSSGSSTTSAGFVGHLGADGGARWAATLGNSVTQLLVDGDDGLLVTGTFSRSLTLAGDASFAASQVPASGQTVFLAHFPVP